MEGAAEDAQKELKGALHPNLLGIYELDEADRSQVESAAFRPRSTVFSADVVIS